MKLLFLLSSDKMIHTSEFVYLARGTEELCHTSNLEWRKDVNVHVIVSGDLITLVTLSYPRLLLCSEGPVTMDTTSHTQHGTCERLLAVPVANSLSVFFFFLQIYNVTGDKQFELVIIDFGSTDLDIEHELSQSTLPRYLYNNHSLVWSQSLFVDGM